MNAYREQKSIIALHSSESSSDDESSSIVFCNNHQGDKMEEMQQQIFQLQQQLQQQALQQQQPIQQNNRFGLKFSEIIQSFNNIPIFTGEDNYTLPTFLRNVKQAERLCCDTNDEFKAYCLTLVINGRISGRAQYCIQRIAEDQKTWANVEQSLKTEFQPSTSIHQELYRARIFKVHNLKDLFEKLKVVECKCIEIQDFNNDNLYNRNIINRELVQIVIDHLIVTEQQHIDETSSLTDLHNKMCKTAIYYSSEIIQPHFRAFRQHNTQQNSNYYRTANENNKTFSYSQNNNLHQLQNKYSGQLLNRNSGHFQNKNAGNFQNNYSGQFQIRNSDHIQNQNSGQFKNINSSQNRNNYNQNPSRQVHPNINRSNQNFEPMEIDNINNTLPDQQQFLMGNQNQYNSQNQLLNQHQTPIGYPNSFVPQYQNQYQDQQSRSFINNQNQVEQHVHFSNMPPRTANP